MSLKNSQQKDVECDTKAVADNSTNMDLFSVSKVHDSNTDDKTGDAVKVETSQKLEDATAKLETQETTDSCLDLSKKSESNTQQSPAEQDLATVTSSSQSPDIVKDINTNTNSQMEACDLSTSRSKLAEVSEQRSPVDYSQQHACDLSSKAIPTTATRPPPKSHETSNSSVSDKTCTNNNDQVFDLSKKSSQPTHQQPSGNGGTANQITKQAVCSNVDQKSTGSEHVTESKEQPERIYNLGKDSDAKIAVNSSAVGSRSVRDLLAERRRSSEGNSNVYVSGVDNLGNIRKTVDSIGTHRQLQNSGSVQQEENEIKVDKHDKDTSYGLVKIDGIWVPYVRRLSSGCQYVAVKTVEAKFLSRFPNVFPEELHRRGPLNSYSMSEEESRLLSEINQKCGITQVLGKNDLLVKLNDFDEFYRIVLRHFMKIRSNVPKSAAAPPRPPLSTAKWIQLNNTVIPCIETSGEKFLPISVVRHSAQLALDESVTGRKCTKEEMDNLNVACRNAGLDFTFSRTAHLVSITEIKRSGAEIYYLKELPGDNPKQHASPIDRLSPGNATNSKANNGLPPIVPGQVSTPSAAKHQNNTRGGMQMPMAGPTAAAALPQTSPQPAQQQQQQQQLHYQPQPQKHQQQQQQQQQLHHQPQPQKHQQQLQQQHQQQQQFQQRQQLQRPDPVPVQNPATPQQNSQQQQSLPIVQAPYQQVQNQSYQETNINTSLNSKTAYYPNREQSQRGFENQSQPNYRKIQPSPTNVPISPQNTEYSMRRTNVNVANQSGHINSSTTAQYSPPRPVNQPIHSSYSNQSASANFVQTNTMQPRGYNYQGHHQRATPAYSPTQPQHISPIPSPTGHTAHNAGDKTLPEHMQPTAMLPMKIAPNVNQQPKCPHTIIPYLFENYSISCLVKATVDEEFALLEAVSRLYFDDYKFSDLEHVLSVRLQVPLYTLSLPEEQAFITFYGLKTERLRSNQAISMRHFVRCYPSLREILPRKRPPRRPKTPELPAHSPRISGVAQGSSEQARNADYARRVFTEHVYQLQAQYNSDPRPMEHRGYKQHAEYAPQQRLQANAYSTNRPNYSLPMKRNHHDPRDLHSAPVAKSSRSYEYQTEAHYKPIA